VHAILPALMLAFTIWMVIDAIQRRSGYIWLMVILLLPFGAWVYYFMVRYKAGPPQRTGQVGGQVGGQVLHLHRSEPAPDLPTLRSQYEESPSIFNKVALAQGLHDTGEFGEAITLFESVLKKRGKERACQYGLARCQAAQADHVAAIATLQQLIAQDRAYLDFAPWAELAQAQSSMDDSEGALETLRTLVRLSPRLDHAVLLAQQLLANDQAQDARAVLVKAIESHRMAPPHVRRAGHQAASAAHALLEEMP
jgi:hypothetical protein